LILSGYIMQLFQKRYCTTLFVCIGSFFTCAL
jgi:hypothetical protein